MPHDAIYSACEVDSVAAEESNGAHTAAPGGSGGDGGCGGSGGGEGGGGGGQPIV